MQVSYTNGPGNAPYGNGDITIHPNGVGCASTTLLGPCAFQPRLWNGRISYETCTFSGNAASGVYGTGCANSAGFIPTLAPTSEPVLGGSLDLEVDAQLPALAGVLMLYGLGKDTFSGLPLPLDLGVIGAPGCDLAMTGDLSSLLLANPGANTVSLPIPNNPALQCFTFYQQAAVVDFAANQLGFVLSNASAAVIGN